MSDEQRAVQAQVLELAASGDADGLEACLAEEEAQANDAQGLDFTDESGLTPLMLAARGNHVSAVETLLTRDGRRATLDFASPVDGRTALHWAGFHGSLDALDTLLRAGANAELRDAAGVCVVEQQEVHPDSSVDAAAVREAVQAGLDALLESLQTKDLEGEEGGHDAEEEAAEEETAEEEEEEDPTPAQFDDDNSGAPSGAASGAVSHREVQDDEEEPETDAAEQNDEADAQLQREQQQQQQAEEDLRIAELERERERQLLQLEQDERAAAERARAAQEEEEEILQRLQREAEAAMEAEAAAAAAKAHRPVNPEDLRVFADLPLEQALEVLATRYTEACAESNQEPLPFVHSAISQLSHPPHSLLLSGSSRLAHDRTPRLTDQSIGPLLDLLAYSFPNLPARSVDLSCNSLSTSSARLLARWVGANHTIRSLDVSGNDMGMEAGEELVEALMDHEAPAQLVQVNLSSNPLGGAILLRWGDFIALNQSVTELNLGHTELDAPALMRIGTALQSNHTLRRLNLDGPLRPRLGLGAETSTHLARSLRLNAGLTHLSLRGHALRDEDVSSAGGFADALRQNGCLRELDLRGNKLTTTGVAALVAAVADRRTGVRIDLDGNGLKGQTFEEIEDAIAAVRGSRNQVAFSSRQDQHTLTAKPLM